MALTGCQTVPQSVKDKTKNYTKTGQVKEVDEQYVSVQHLLDDKDEVLKADYQNMILDDTISLEQPDSVGVLQLEVPKHFATKDKVKTLSKVVLQKEVSDADVKDLSKEKWAIGETYGVGKNEQNMESAEVDQDGSYTAVFAKPWIIGVESVSKIYHPDWGRPLGTCKLNGKEGSLDDQVAYVNDWCDKYTKLFEPDYECKVKTVYQCKGDGVEYLCFEACKYYKGLPFDDTDLMEINNKDGEEQSYVRNVLELTTVGTEKINSLRNNNYSFVVKKEKTYNDHLIGLKQAVRLAEKTGRYKRFFLLRCESNGRYYRHKWLCGMISGGLTMVIGIFCFEMAFFVIDRVAFPSSATFLGFIPIVFLVLIADFPRIDQNMIFKICRAGRKKWIVSQLLFLLCADLSFVVLLFVGVTLPVLKQGFLYNGWSDVVTEMLKTFPELKNSSLAQFIPANLYYQMLPYRAVLYSAGFLILYLYLLGLLMLLCKIHGRGALGVVVSGGLVIAGSGFVHLQKIAIKWLFPAAHGIVQTHYSTYYRRMDCTLQTSFLYFALLIGICILAALRYAKKIDYIDIVQME